jgi:hypothetical protein
VELLPALASMLIMDVFFSNFVVIVVVIEQDSTHVITTLCFLGSELGFCHFLCNVLGVILLHINLRMG